MTVLLAPLPDGLEGDVVERLQQIICAMNGYAGQGIRFHLTEYRADERYVTEIRNRGTDGLHSAWYLSTADVSSATPIVEIQDAGLFADSITVTDLTVSDDLIVTDDLFVGGTGFFDEGIDVIGGAIIGGAISLDATAPITSLTTIQATRFISTVSGSFPATGTAPFTVASSRVVTNLNVNYLQGHPASDFVLASGGGDVHVTGELLVDGNTTLGNANTDAVAIPGNILVGTQTFYANAATNRVGIGTNTPGASYVLDVNGDVNLQDTLNVGDDIFTGGDSIFGGGSGNTHAFNGTVAFNQDVHMVQGLDVDQSANIDGNLHVDGSIDSDSGITADGGFSAGANSTFTSASFSSTATFNGGVSWADGSGAGFAFASPSSARLNVTIPGVGTFKIPLY